MLMPEVAFLLGEELRCVELAKGELSIRPGVE